MSVVIQVENLSKDDRLGTIGGGTLREELSRWWMRYSALPPIDGSAMLKSAFLI